MKQTISQIVISKLVEKKDVAATLQTEFYIQLLKGKLTSIEIAAFLTALRSKGENATDLFIGAQSLRTASLPFKSMPKAIDIVGTGGDKLNTLNISTASALVLAACGIKVAKHGNKSVSSSCGASDLLSELGINLQARPDSVRKSINKTNFGFLFAPNYNPGLKHAAEARSMIGIRTIFNILGPLVNPAKVNNYLLGVYDPKWLNIYANTLEGLSARSAWIVYCDAGCDELTTLANNRIVVYKQNQKINNLTLNPIDLDFKTCSYEDIAGSSPEQNAKKLLEVFEGAENSYYDNIVLNTAAGLVIMDRVSSLREGVDLAKSIIASKKPIEVIKQAVKISNEDC